jgi:hypothetical protein
MQYLSQIICAILGFLAGVGVTLTVKKRKDSNVVHQSNIKAGGDVVGRDINKKG